MIFPSGYTSEQRYQLARLAEIPNLNLATYEHYRGRILAGEAVFETVIKTVRIIPNLQKRKEHKLAAILAHLEQAGECDSVELAHAAGVSRIYLTSRLMPVLEVRGSVSRRRETLSARGGFRCYWRLA